MHITTLLTSIMAFAITAESAAIATVTPTTSINAASLLKRDGEHSMLVTGSGGARNAEVDAGQSVSVSVACGTITASGISNYGGACTAQLAGGFSGCDGCMYNGKFPTFSFAVSMKCGNAHARVQVSTSSGGGDIGENINTHDCNGKAGGGVKVMNVCAGNDWTLFRC